MGSSQEIRKFVNGRLNLKVTDDDKKEEKVLDQTYVNQLLLSSATRIEDEPIHETNTVEGTQVILLISNPINTRKTTAVAIKSSEDFTRSTSEIEDLIVDGVIELYLQEDNDRLPSNFRSSATTNDNQIQKRHIMISYNQSSRKMDMKYKVWMDKTNMGDDILVSMARAVENSYIVLLCINTQYYRSHYCRLEAEYAAEKRIRFIPCMMEKSFRAESWRGVIKGSSLHVDFSVHEKFEESFKELIRLISQIEKQLCVQPRKFLLFTGNILVINLGRTPTPCNLSGRMLFGDMSTTNAESPTHTHDQHTYRCNSIVEQYKRSIHKEGHDLKHLKHHQLLDLINKLLRRQSTTKTSRSSRYSYSEQSDEDTKQPRRIILPSERPSETAIKRHKTALIFTLFRRNPAKYILCDKFIASIPKLYFSSPATQLKSPNHNYVPPHQKPLTDDIDKFQKFTSNSQRLFIVTDAGISTESGIPWAGIRPIFPLFSKTSYFCPIFYRRK
ncbi:unnamed protein product [Rotaria magnacalcarata]|uniref:TIR domain-containing protein n=1 Tax=Rotaria magnacalcarata TaxID=392030 RepID=A0A816Y2D9_9BILA|nr:unnamed protein product [Rotaria magnacalcarata]